MRMSPWMSHAQIRHGQIQSVEKASMKRTGFSDRRNHPAILATTALRALGASNVCHNPDSNASRAEPESVAAQISHGLQGFRGKISTLK